MTFYVFIDESWNQVYVEIEPKLTKAFDTTNDTFSCVLKANNQQLPYKPMTPFKIVDDNNKVQLMWISNDNVSIFSLSKSLYKHTLTLVQYRYFLNKHLVRNTVFNQPRERKQNLYMAVSSVYAKTLDDTKWSYRLWSASTDDSIPKIWYDQIIVNRHTRVRAGSIGVKLYGISRTNSNPKTQRLERITDLNDLSTGNAQLLSNDAVVCEIVDVNTSTTIDSITPFTYLYGGLTDPVALDEYVVNNINDYLSHHNGAKLCLRYYVNDSLDVWNSAFCDTVDGTLADSRGSFTYWALLTLQVDIQLELYNYTMYDVLNILNKQYRLTDSNGHKRDYLYNLPNQYSTGKNLELYNLLTTTYPPDTLSFTQATFYDALTEVFRFYDAGFSFDENRMLQIEYYNDPQRQITLEQGGLTLNHTDKNFNNGRVAYYQNAIQEVSQNDLNVRSTDLGVPAESAFEIVVTKPIYSINKLEFDLDVVTKMSLRAAGELSSEIDTTISHLLLDLSYFIVSRDIWSALTNRTLLYNDYTVLTQQGTVPFDRESKSINISSYYRDVFNFKNSVMENVIKLAFCRFLGYDNETKETIHFLTNFEGDKWSTQRYNINYIATTNGRTVVETIDNKYKGEQLVNQGGGIIDLNKLGLNILGESLKDGEPTLTASCKITNWNDRIQEGDYFVDSNGQYWVANIIEYTLLADGIYQENIEFSKNFNALSLRVNSDKEKRLTNISGEKTVISEDNFIEYIYIFDYNDSAWVDLTITDYTEIKLSNIYYLIKNTFNPKIQKAQNINAAFIMSYDDDNNTLLTYYPTIPLVKYGAGNCICFEVQYDSPINAGNQMLVNQTGWWSGQKYFSQATPYTDDEGWADKISISFAGTYTFNGNYPKAYNFSTLFQINKLVYYKKPNEIFALNYELCFLTYQNRTTKRQEIFIGSAFINDNFYTLNDNIAKKSFYIKYTLESDNDDFKYSILDTQGHGTHRAAINDVVLGYDDNNYPSVLNICFKINSGTINTKTWAIVDEQNRIYISSNTPKQFSSTGIVYQLSLCIGSKRKDFEYH